MSKDKPPTPPGAGNGASPAGGASKSCCPTDFVLSPCRIVKVKGTLQISATELPDFPGGTYKWTTSSTKIRLTNPDSSTVTVEGLDNPSAARDAEVITVTRKASGCADVVKQVKVTVARIKFSESATQKYGYDNFDTAADTLDDHVSIKKADFTFIHVEIEGGATSADFNFVCDDAALCTPTAPVGHTSFELLLTAGNPAENKKETTLHARSKCPGAESFTHIQVHVYKEKVVDVVVAKFDKTAAGTNLQWPTTDYAAHQGDANVKLKQAVVKYNITNFDAANAVTPVNLASGTATVTYDIKAGGGADLTAISAAMSGTGTKVRIAIIRDMVSVYYLKNAAAVGDTTLTVTADSTFFHVGDTPPCGTGANRENITITALSGGTITCAALTKAHAVGDTIEFPAAGWSSDPILVTEGSGTVIGPKWSMIHEVGHRKLTLKDIIDLKSVMHFSRDRTDYGLRYCPRTRNYPAGTTDTENQWETIPRD